MCLLNIRDCLPYMGKNQAFILLTKGVISSEIKQSLKNVKRDNVLTLESGSN